MPELLKPGQKVKYTYEGEEQDGVIHGVKTHETPDGQVTRVSYLVDTGETVREDHGANEKTGKPETVRQPEQVEIHSDHVRLA